MRVEGCEGQVIPAEVYVPLSDAEFRVIEREAYRREVYRGYRGSFDLWKNGLINGACCFGMCGEYGLSKFLTHHGFASRLDTTLRSKGDGGVDFSFRGTSIQIKTSVTHNDNLIKRVSEDGLVLPLRSDVYLFARLDFPSAQSSPSTQLGLRLIGGSRKRRPTRVALKGWTRREDVLANPLNVLEPARRGTHMNLVVDSRTLEPMSRLLVRIHNGVAA